MIRPAFLRDDDPYLMTMARSRRVRAAARTARILYPNQVAANGVKGRRVVDGERSM
jgi:hypothetical protein